MSNEIEIWKDVPNYEGLYQVSNFGNVRSLNYRRSGKERILKPSKDKDGYLRVVLSKNGEKKYITIHKLVAIVYKGHVPDGTQRIVVDHKDNDKLNNRAYNIQLVTNRENSSKDRVINYTGVSFNKKMNCWQAKIHFNGRKIHLGTFDTEIEAANAYQKAKKEADEGLDLNILYPKWANKTSQYEGVSWIKSRGKWLAYYKRKKIAYFDEELEAYKSRENYIKQLTN